MSTMPPSEAPAHESSPKNSLISPWGDRLVDLVAGPEESEELRTRASYLPSLQISRRCALDLELLASGAFSPLTRFMNRADHERVVAEMRLESDTLFPVPIALPTAPPTTFRLDEEIALRDSRNDLLAIMTVEEIYEWDFRETARAVLGTLDMRHPLVTEMHGWGNVNLSGRLQVLRPPRRPDFAKLRLSPSETRSRLEEMNFPNVVAFQTRNPLHRAHEELTRRAMEETGGALLLHPVVGMTRPGDVDQYTRVRTYRVLARNYYDSRRVLLSLLPLAMRMAGPREALWHALIRRNYGANALIVGRDHGSPGAGRGGRPFYEPYEAQELVRRFSGETGVKMIPFRQLVYLPDEDRYEEAGRGNAAARTASISGSQVRDDYLRKGRDLPRWFTRPEVADILAEAYPPRHHQGVCVWLTGLSGSGKSTTAQVLTVLLQEQGRKVTVLDGDVVRTHLSRGLGFSKEDRDTNILRIGFVAAEIVRHGGTVICAAVSPYRETRNQVRSMVGSGHFVEVFVDTPLEVCEERDTKGMYAKARRGEIRGFTGIDDPYESPRDPEIILDTVRHPPQDNAQDILDHLVRRGYVRPAE